MTRPEVKAARRRENADRAMRALARHGNPDRAAAALGIHVSTLRKWVQDYCVLNGFDTPVQAAYELGKEQNRAPFAPKAA